MPKSLEEQFATFLRQMWKQPDRLRTLARIAFHQRQFETWWKFELATHLWEFAAPLGADVFIESLGRADVVLACTNETSGIPKPDMGRSPRIPIELKTIGTWWGSSKITKAYQENGKKTLSQDMDTARVRSRSADPFAVVGLLITHDQSLGEEVLCAYVDSARELGVKYGLTELINDRIVLPPQSMGQATAQQLLWIARS